MDINPSSNEPRHESPGEREQRWADNLNTISRRSGLKLTDAERILIVRFAIRMVSRLGDKETKALEDVFIDLVSWWLSTKASP